MLMYFVSYCCVYDHFSFISVYFCVLFYTFIFHSKTSKVNLRVCLKQFLRVINARIIEYAYFTVLLLVVDVSLRATCFLSIFGCFLECW